MFHGMEFDAMLQTNSEEFNLSFLDPINLEVSVFVNMWVNNEVHMFRVRYDVMSAGTLTVLAGFLNAVRESLLSQC